MSKPVSALPFLALVAVSLIGCGKPVKTVAKTESNTAEAFLEWSMDQYHQAKGFSATCSFQLSSLALPANGHLSREVNYESPNLFRVVTDVQHGVKVYCISNGSKEVDYSNEHGTQAISSDAPPSFSEATSSTLNDPTIASSILYRFFGGSGNIATVEKQLDEPATWGKDGVSPSGEKTKTVRFISPGPFGHVEAAIGVTTGLVYTITFDSAPEVTALLQGHSPEDVIEHIKAGISTVPPGKKRDDMAQILKVGPSAFSIVGVETYIDPKFEAPAGSNLFDITLPKGTKLAPPPPDGKPPVAFGKQAPDFSVKDSSGKTVKLSSFKGHVVLIDFWATWCGPCKEGLPVTAALAEKFGKRGLKVLAVSAEDPRKIADFVSQQSYKLPAYCDAALSADRAYHVSPIPTTVVIDAKGNLSDYLTGLRDPAEIEQSLMRAGLNIGS
jgi:peroxiredoxin